MRGVGKYDTHAHAYAHAHAHAHAPVAKWGTPAAMDGRKGARAPGGPSGAASSGNAIVGAEGVRENSATLVRAKSLTTAPPPATKGPIRATAASTAALYTCRGGEGGEGTRGETRCYREGRDGRADGVGGGSMQGGTTRGRTPGNLSASTCVCATKLRSGHRPVCLWLIEGRHKDALQSGVPRPRGCRRPWGAGRRSASSPPRSAPPASRTPRAAPAPRQCGPSESRAASAHRGCSAQSNAAGQSQGSRRSGRTAGARYAARGGGGGGGGL
jgi:hypothetical protein